MKKLRFVSVIIVLLLFCPFIKQCDGFTKIEEGAKADNSNELKVYFTEESENVFDFYLYNIYINNRCPGFYKKQNIRSGFHTFIHLFFFICKPAYDAEHSNNRFT